MALENSDFIFATSLAGIVGYVAERFDLRAHPASSIGAPLCCALNPAGTVAAFGASAGQQLLVVNASTWAAQAVSWTGGEVRALAFSPGGEMLAVAHASAPYLTVFETAGWTALPTVATPPAGAANGLAWSPTSQRLAVAHAAAPYLSVYNTTTWAKLATPGTLPAGECRAVAFSPDGARLAVGGFDANPVFLLEYATADWSVTPIAALPGAVKCLAWSPDGLRLAVGPLGGGELRAYNTTNWSYASLPITGGPVHAVDWEHADSLLAGFEAWPRMARWKPSDGTFHAFSGVQYPVKGVAAKRYTPMTISGAIKDVNLNGVLREVRAYRRDTGELAGAAISNGLTGAYSIPCAHDGEHTVVMMDDLVGTVENDQVLRTTPV